MRRDAEIVLFPGIRVEYHAGEALPPVEPAPPGRRPEGGSRSA